MYPWHINVLKADLGLGIAATDSTAAAMAEMIRAAEFTPIVRGCAEALIAKCPERRSSCEIKQIFNFVKFRMRFTRDPYRREFIKTPEVHLMQIERQGRGFGDCDDFTVLLGALLKSVGHPVRILVIRSPWNTENSFNHVLLQVQFLGRWMPLDATAKNQPIFWEPPSVSKKAYEV